MKVKGAPRDHVIQSRDCSEQGLLEKPAEEHSQSDSEHLQRWRLHNFAGKPVPVCDYPHSKKSFFICLSGISCTSVCAHYLSPFTEKGLVPESLLPSISYVPTFPRSPSVFSLLNTPSTLSLPHVSDTAIPSSSSQALLWTCSSMSQNWSQHSRHHLHGAEKGTITSRPTC